MSLDIEAWSWAREEFATADLGDRRRTRRLMRLGALAANSPAGRVTEVCVEGADRQGAYDLLESPQVVPAAIGTAIGEAAARRASESERVWVVVDGTSVTLVDAQRSKGLGAIGTYGQGAQGLKLVDALLLDDRGMPLGMLAQTWWRRPSQRPTRRRAAHRRPIRAKETHHWLETIDAAVGRLATHAPGVRAVFVIDREGDAAVYLCQLVRSGHDLVVRAHCNRRVALDDGRVWPLRRALAYTRALGTFVLDVAPGPGRTGRQARLSVVARPFLLTLRDPVSQRACTLRLWAVHAREITPVPRGEAPLDWLLWTSLTVDTLPQAHAILRTYACRWRAEDVHKCWKSGACNIERSQLRERNALVKWSMLLLAVSVRIERLKHLARNDPDAPASVELTPSEIEALILLKRRHKKRTEVIADGVPSIAQAVRWIADLGGYTGKSSGGPPGVITIGRGFERVRAGAQTIDALRAAGKIR